MNKKTITIWVALLIILIVLIAVRGGSDHQNVPIKIGVIAPLSGFLADYGEEIRKGVLDAASSTPTANVNVQFVFEDDGCEPKNAVSAFNKLNTIDRVGAIIGPACGSPQEAIVPLIKEAGPAVLVMSAASEDLHQKSGGNFFNIQYSLEDESSFVAKTLAAKGYKKVALVTYANAFSEAHRKAFMAAFPFPETVYEHVLIENTTDVSTEVAKIRSEKPDVIYSPDIAFFFAGGLTKLRQLGVTAPVYSTYVAELPAVRTLVPDVYYSFPSDLLGQEGAVYELSKQAALVAIDAVSQCDGKRVCISEQLTKGGAFNQNGVYKRALIIKKIEGDSATSITQ